MTCSEIFKLLLGVLEPKVNTQSETTAEQALSDSTADSAERLLGALETAVRTLIPLSIQYDQAGTDLQGFPLTEESPFPLPPRFVSATVYLTGYLLDGNTRLNNLYSAECEAIRREIPTEITAIAQIYRE